MKLLHAFIFLLLSTVVSATSMASSQQKTPAPRTFYVNPIRVKGLNMYRGLYLTVYYALGSRGSLSSEENQITLREVKEKRSFQILDDTVLIPEVNLKRANLFITYNIMVFVIHRTPNFTWLNGNKNLPIGEKNSTNITARNIDSLTKLEFESIVKASEAGPNAEVSYQFRSRNSIIGN